MIRICSSRGKSGQATRDYVQCAFRKPLPASAFERYLRPVCL